MSETELCFACPSCGAGLVAAVRSAPVPEAPKVDAAAAAKAKLRALAEGLPPEEQGKLAHAISVWAGDNPGRLASLVERVRARLTALGVPAAGEGPAEPLPRPAASLPDLPGPGEPDALGFREAAGVDAPVAPDPEPLKLTNPKGAQHATMTPEQFEASRPAPEAPEAPAAPEPEPPPWTHLESGQERRLGEHFWRWARVLLDPEKPVPVEQPPAMKGAKSTVAAKSRDQYMATWFSSPALLVRAVEDLWGRVPKTRVVDELKRAYAGVPGGDRLLTVALASLKKRELTPGVAMLNADQSAAMAHYQARLAAIGPDEGEEAAEPILAEARADARLTGWAVSHLQGEL